MIYKFIDGQKSLEAARSNYEGTKVVLTFEDEGKTTFTLDSQSLYQFIGALHSLQAQIKKGDTNG
jgi:hypothetical protein